MKFEFVEFYPFPKPVKKENRTYIGTVHVYLPETNVDIRGIRVYKRGPKLFYNLPYDRAWNVEEKKFVGFPVVSFTLPQDWKAFLEYMSLVASPIIASKLKNDAIGVQFPIDKKPSFIEGKPRC